MEVINPVSFGLCSEDGEFQSYWSQTAMTTFLTDALKKRPLNFAKIDIDQRTLDAYEPESPQLTTLLYQTGYLTISGFRQMGGMRKYDLAGKKVIKIGVSFSSEKRTITDVKVA